jgi:hypothetical protein
MMDSLSEGCNYFHVFTTPDGEFTTGERIRPGLRINEDYHGSQLTFDKMAIFTPGTTQEYAEGVSWNGDLGDSGSFSFPQASLWNQVVASASFADVQQIQISAIADPDSLLDSSNIGQYITVEKQIENAANVGALFDISSWHCYYADFHSVQLTIETPVQFFVDRRVNPYARVSIGYDWRSGDPSYWDYAELAWRFSSGENTIRKTYGSSPKFYFPILDNPASPL